MCWFNRLPTGGRQVSYDVDNRYHKHADDKNNDNAHGINHHKDYWYVTL